MQTGASAKHKKRNPGTNVFGFVLAGGRSSRMGTDKASVIIDGKSMLEHTKSILAEVSGEVAVVGGAYADIADAMPFSGPASAIARLISSHSDYEDTIALFMPVDMPRVETVSLEALISQVKKLKKPAYFERDYLPVALPVSTELTQALCLLLEASKAPSMRQLLQITEARSVPRVGSASSFVNLNTPEAISTASRQTLATERK